MEINKFEVGKRISIIRKSLGKNMDEFGGLVSGASKSNVSKWENGISIPSNERLKVIAELGNTTVEELLYSDEKQKLTIGYEAFNNLLASFSKETLSGKALRYFDKESQERIILRAVNIALDVSRDKDSNKQLNSIKGTNGLHFQIESNFVEQYMKDVKTNQNLLEKLKYISYEIEELTGYDSYKVYSLNDLLVDKFEASINSNLLEEIEELKDTLSTKIQELKEKYPDEKQELGIRVFRQPTEEEFYDSANDEIMEPFLIIKDDESLKKIRNDEEMKEFVMNRIENI